jgi:hypothetical protein
MSGFNCMYLNLKKKREMSKKPDMFHFRFVMFENSFLEIDYNILTVCQFINK